jgi:hypothetical protein
LPWWSSGADVDKAFLLGFEVLPPWQLGENALDAIMAKETPSGFLHASPKSSYDIGLPLALRLIV